MFQQIRELKKEGLSQAEIASRLEIDPKTVAKYVRDNSPPRYRARKSLEIRAQRYNNY